eukprot:tig00021254_g19722.t1
MATQSKWTKEQLEADRQATLARFPTKDMQRAARAEARAAQAARAAYDEQHQISAAQRYERERALAAQKEAEEEKRWAEELRLKEEAKKAAMKLPSWKWKGNCHGDKGVVLYPAKGTAELIAKDGLGSSQPQLREMYTIYETEHKNIKSAKSSDFKPQHEFSKYKEGVCCPAGSTWAVVKTYGAKVGGHGKIHCCSNPRTIWRNMKSFYAEHCRDKSFNPFDFRLAGDQYTGQGYTWEDALREGVARDDVNRQVDSEAPAPYSADGAAAGDSDGAGAAWGLELQGEEEGAGALAEGDAAAAFAFGPADEAALADRHAAPLL